MRRVVTAIGKLLLTISGIGAIVGLIRQRREFARTRGPHTGIGAATVSAPPDNEDPLSGAVARWVPATPRTPGGRVLAATIAAPLTLVGFALGATTGGSWRRDSERQCWVVTGARSGAGAWQERLGYDANAVGQVVLSRPEEPSDALLAHEAVHVRHAERIGFLLVPLYAVLWARWGYLNHPLERAARLGAARATATAT